MQVREAWDLALTSATNLLKLLFWPLSNLGLKEIRWLVHGYTATTPDKSCTKKSSLWTFRLRQLTIPSGDRSDLYLWFFLQDQITYFRAQTSMDERLCVNSDHSLPSLQIRWTGAVHNYIPSLAICKFMPEYLQWCNDPGQSQLSIKR